VQVNRPNYPLFNTQRTGKQERVNMGEITCGTAKDFSYNKKTTKRCEDYMRKWEIGYLVGLSILACLVYYFPVLNSGNNLGIQDWDQNFAWTEYTRISLLDFHQFPFWNPYKCGGSVQFANPQIPVISFQTVFSLLFGTVRGIKLSIFFHGVIGFIGFYLLAKQYKLSTIGSLLASTIFSFSGITGSFLSTGMVVFTSFAYTPFILYCFNKSLNNGKWGIICGVLFALSFYSGYHISLLLSVYILVYVLVTSIVKLTFIPIKAFLTMLSASVLIMLPKLLLSIQLIRIIPRLYADVSGYRIQGFFYFLLSQKQNLFNQMNIQGSTFNIDENSIYIGILSFVLFILFFVRNKNGVMNNISLLITLLIIFGIMLGNAEFPFLYTVMKHLPVFSSFRVAQRFRFDFIIPFSLLIGLGLDNIVRILHRYKIAEPLSVLCLAVIYVDLTIFSSINFLSNTLIIKNPESQLSKGQVFYQTEIRGLEIPIKRTIQLPSEFLDTDRFMPFSFEYLKIKQNMGILSCYDSITYSVYAAGIENQQDYPKYQGEFYLMDPVQGVKVENTYWSPNKLVYTITNAQKAKDDTLIINQNYYPGWIERTGPFSCSRVTIYQGLIATRLDGVADSVTLEFNPLFLYLYCRH
jgi:hypothetical protein